MENIGKIVSRIESDTQLEIDAVRAESQAKCDEIIAEYEKKAQEQHRSIMTEGAKKCKQRSERLLSTAEMEAKKNILAFKQEMVSQAFALAEQKIGQMTAETYIAFLAKKAADASRFGTEELVFNAKDKSSYGAQVAKAANALLAQRGVSGKLTVSEETRDIAGGVIVKQGDIETNCTTQTLMQLYRNELASQVAELLFG